jgi:hypothetical protein
MNNEVVGQLIANAIVTTALLSNELCIQTKGEYLIHESDYLHYVKDFQDTLARKIVPVSSLEGMREEASKYISELLIIKLKGNEDGTDSGTASTIGENLEIFPDGAKQNP